MSKSDVQQEAPKSLKAQIIGAKIALDSARRIGDKLHIDLAEDALNSLLDDYHTYHTSQTGE